MKGRNDGTVIGMAVTETYGYNMVANPKAGFTQADITPLTTTAGFQMGIVSLASKGWNDFGDVIAVRRLVKQSVGPYRRVPTLPTCLARPMVSSSTSSSPRRQGCHERRECR